MNQIIDAILTSSSTGYKSEEPDWLSRKSDFEEIPANDPHPFRKIDPNGVKSFLDTAFNVADKVMGTTGQGKTRQKGLQIRLPSDVIIARLQQIEQWFQGHCRNCLFVFVSARSDKMHSKSVTKSWRSYMGLLFTASA